MVKFTSWKILKSDVSIAKNYLGEDEMESLGRIVNAYLEVAEDMAKRKIPLTMNDWAIRLDKFLDATDRGIINTRLSNDNIYI